MTTNKTKPLPDHLGGHLNKVHTDDGALEFAKRELNVSTMLDIGCGPGWQVELAREKNITAFGIDGDYEVLPGKEYFELIDFTKDRYLSDKTFDLAWSVEFLEHVDEKYIDNYLPAFMACKSIICTFAPPGTPGHHHVNCQEEDYWIELFANVGFKFEEALTKQLRNESTMQKPFIQMRGMVFSKR